MMESNLSSSLLTSVGKNERKFSKEQYKLMYDLAKKHGITMEEITRFLGAIGDFIKEYANKGKVIHIQKFGKFVPNKNAKENYAKTRKEKAELRAQKSRIQSGRSSST